MSQILRKLNKLAGLLLLAFALASGSIANAGNAPLDPNDYLALDDKQIGSMRHLLKLSRQLPGDWADMGENNPEAFMPTLIFQIAFATYGIGQVQYHYTPAYRELPREIMENFIEKQLHYSVWDYWLVYSMGGKILNPDQDKLFPPETNPVREDNIMYGAHVLQMTAMYEMFYRNGKYTEPGAITFVHGEEAWGNGPESFEYDLHSLTDHVLQAI